MKIITQVTLANKTAKMIATNSAFAFFSPVRIFIEFLHLVQVKLKEFIAVTSYRSLAQPEP